MQSPNNGFALFHMYFTIGQPSADTRSNLIYGGGAFEEVGETVGSLQHSNTTSVQYYWATCVDPSNHSLCNLHSGYFEGPMSPNPGIKVPDLIEFQAVDQTHNGSGYWWDLYIKDDTTNSAWIRGGGTAGSSCCSSAISWGGEANGAGGYTHLPTTNGDLLTYKPVGNANYYYWGRSNQYPPQGGGACQADDAVFDSTLPGCPDQASGLSGLQAGYWNSKYISWTYRQNH